MGTQQTNNTDTLDDAAEEYHTYRVLSADETFETVIQDVHFTGQTLYLEISVKSVTLYLKVQTQDDPPSNSYTVLESITDSKGVLPTTLTSETIQINVAEDIESAMITDGSHSASVDIQKSLGDMRDLTLEQEDSIDYTDTVSYISRPNAKQAWIELNKKCSFSYWFSTTDNFKDSDARNTQITNVSEITDTSITFEIESGRIPLELTVDRPENADVESNVSAEFIEQLADGDLRFLDNGEIIIYLHTSGNKIKTTVAQDEYSWVYGFSEEQFEDYVLNYTPTNQTSISTTTRGSSDSIDGGKSLQFGVVFVFNYITYHMLFRDILASKLPENVASASAQTGTMTVEKSIGMVQFMDSAFGIMGFVGALAIALGIVLYFQNELERSLSST